MEDTPNPKNRGLGRGLNALFEDGEDTLAPAQAAEASVSGTRKPLTLPIEQIAPNVNQPRQHFEDAPLEELTESIREYGILQPILVRALSEGKEARYEIIAGERRWRAAQRVPLHEIPVNILTLDEERAYQIALIENLQREDLDPIDEASGYQHMVQSFGYTQDQAAKAVGKSRPHIANMLRLLSLPVSVQMMVRQGALSAGHARAIATSDDPEGLARQITEGNLSVRQTEALAGAGSGKGPGKKRPREDKSHIQSFGKKDPDTILLEADVSAALGMAVSIDAPDGKKGKISIAFTNLDQLDDLLARLSSPPGSRRLMG